MAEYYGTLQGSRGTANRCGTRSSGITASARSWHGSITVELHADGATIRVADGSQVGGRVLWSGLLSELLKARSIVLLDYYACRGCGREESVCSGDPCAAVIADREA